MTTDVKADERCSCGATFSVSGYSGHVHKALEEWRAAHHKICAHNIEWEELDTLPLMQTGVFEQSVWPLEHSQEALTNVHDRSLCAGEFCTIHNRSDHHMREWPQHWRSDRGIMERICPHGVGHPDPDSPFPRVSVDWTHGCDGCCHVD